MRPLPSRRHVPHEEHPEREVCITWRLHRGQLPLTPPERDVVFEIVKRCEPEFARLLAAVIMDDHAHVLVCPRPTITARRLVSAWKGASSHAICGTGLRNAPLWQRDYFDRWMASDEQTSTCAAYIELNPKRRWPNVIAYPWLVTRSDRRSPPAA